MKKHNPSTPLLVREAFGVPPKIWARYGMRHSPLPSFWSSLADGSSEMGKESSVSVDGLSSGEVEKKLQELAQKSS